MDNKIIADFSNQAYSAFMNGDKKKFSENMKNFFIEGIDNPSIAHIIIKDEFNKNKEKETTKIIKSETKLNKSLRLYKSLFTDRHYELPNADNSIGVIPYREDFKKEYKKLYPKTFNVRNNLIFLNRILMDKVTPKAGWHQKVSVGPIQGSYKDIYPNTISKRCLLFMKNKIKEGEITKKYNWFQKIKFAATLKKVIKNIK